ncbi:hypothetical protein D3C84_1021960 [compost metagenome]
MLIYTGAAWAAVVTAKAAAAARRVKRLLTRMGDLSVLLWLYAEFFHCSSNVSDGE